MRTAGRPQSSGKSSGSLNKQRIQCTRELFAAWSSGDLDKPKAFLHPDAVLHDVIGGSYRGWTAIRAYFAKAVEHWPDLRLEPTGEFWTRADGLALTWTMSATVTDDRYGPEHRGRRWTVDGMSFLIFEGTIVVHEKDFHDHGARERSLRAAGNGDA